MGADMNVEDTVDADAPGEPPAGDMTGDMVDRAVEQVRSELAERRRTGEIPHLPDGELERHFDGVVEAVDGALVETSPIGSAGLMEAAALETWRPGSLRSRLLGVVLYPLSRLLGALIRRQVGGFSRRTAEILHEVVDRQNRMQRFLARAHLDRIRTLEYRVAELERELEALRGVDRDR
jgi:hypothetical protein